MQREIKGKQDKAFRAEPKRDARSAPRTHISDQARRNSDSRVSELHYPAGAEMAGLSAFRLGRKEFVVPSSP